MLALLSRLYMKMFYTEYTEYKHMLCQSIQRMLPDIESIRFLSVLYKSSLETLASDDTC